MQQPLRRVRGWLLSCIGRRGRRFPKGVQLLQQSEPTVPGSPPSSFRRESGPSSTASAQPEALGRGVQRRSVVKVEYRLLEHATDKAITWECTVEEAIARLQSRRPGPRRKRLPAAAAAAAVVALAAAISLAAASPGGAAASGALRAAAPATAPPEATVSGRSDRRLRVPGADASLSHPPESAADRDLDPPRRPDSAQNQKAKPASAPLPKTEADDDSSIVEGPTENGHQTPAPTPAPEEETYGPVAPEAPTEAPTPAPAENEYERTQLCCRARAASAEGPRGASVAPRRKRPPAADCVAAAAPKRRRPSAPACAVAAAGCAVLAAATSAGSAAGVACGAGAGARAQAASAVDAAPSAPAVACAPGAAAGAGPMEAAAVAVAEVEEGGAGVRAAPPAEAGAQGPAEGGGFGTPAAPPSALEAPGVAAAAMGSRSSDGALAGGGADAPRAPASPCVCSAPSGACPGGADAGERASTGFPGGHAVVRDPHSAAGPSTATEACPPSEGAAAPGPLLVAHGGAAADVVPGVGVGALDSGPDLTGAWDSGPGPTVRTRPPRQCPGHRSGEGVAAPFAGGPAAAVLSVGVAAGQRTADPTHGGPGAPVDTGGTGLSSTNEGAPQTPSSADSPALAVSLRKRPHAATEAVGAGDRPHGAAKKARP